MLDWCIKTLLPLCVNIFRQERGAGTISGDKECKYTLAVLVRDQELGIVDVESEILKKLTDIKIFIVGSKDGDHPDMDIGGLVVLKMP